MDLKSAYSVHPVVSKKSGLRTCCLSSSRQAHRSNKSAEAFQQAANFWPIPSTYPCTCSTPVSPGCTGVACTTAAIRSTSVPGLTPRSCSMVVHLRGLNVQCRGPAPASSCCCHLVWRVVHSSSCLQQVWHRVGCLSAEPAHQPRSLKECSCWLCSAQSSIWGPACRALPTGPFCTEKAALSPQGPLSA